MPARELKVLAVHEPTLGRRRFVTSSLCALAAFALGGCSSSTQRRLNIFNYSNYIAPNTVKLFSAKHKVSVVYDEFSSQDVLFAKLKLGAGYDLVVASDYMLRRLIRQKVIATIDSSFVHRNAIMPRFRHVPWDPHLQFSVPYLWGTTGIGYNRRKVKEIPHSWKDLWDYRYRGYISMLDEKRDTLGAALILLGYDGNSTNPDELQQASKVLLEQQPLLRQYTNDVIDGLARNQLWLAQAWSGDAARAREANSDIDYYLPDEGSFVFVDSWCIPRTAEHYQEAIEFLNYVMQPEVVAQVTNTTGFPSTIEAAKEFVDNKNIDQPLGYPPPDMLARTVFQTDLGSKEQMWDNIWGKIKFQSGSING